MLNNLIKDRVLEVLSRGLDGADLRHKVISHNIANAGTPNYKRVLVSFEEELKSALGRSPSLKGTVTDEKHIPINFVPLDEMKPHLIGTEEQTLRNDGNNVDINVEMANMSVNSTKYNAFTALFSRKVQMLKMAMRERLG